MRHLERSHGSLQQIGLQPTLSNFGAAAFPSYHTIVTARGGYRTAATEEAYQQEEARLAAKEARLAAKEGTADSTTKKTLQGGRTTTLNSNRISKD
jgi:hypothetical protein